jgi:23S rRNA (uracil1939-C5)-methyltransferase
MRKEKKTGPIRLTGMHPTGRASTNFKGKGLFVDFAIPGETVNAIIDKKDNNCRIGHVSEIIKSSESRCIPVCKHFGLCGGCNWQHLQYEAQLEWKRYIIEWNLQKNKIICPRVSEVIASPEIFFYRNKMNYAFAANRWLYDNEVYYEDEHMHYAMGFHLFMRPERIFHAEECYLQKEPSRTICKVAHQLALEMNLTYYNSRKKTGILRGLTIRTTTHGECMVILLLTCNENNLIEKYLQQIHQQVPAITSIYWGVNSDLETGYEMAELNLLNDTQPFIYETIGHCTYKAGPKTFLQPNPRQATQLYAKIAEFAALTGTERLYDLYCGAGTISCYLAKNASEVIGIEASDEAVAFADENATLNGLKNTKFISGDMKEVFTTDFIATHGQPDVIILDPPRAGTRFEIKKVILKSKAQRVVYVSCNPVSLAYDLRLLTTEFEITNIEAFDQFPHTQHVETIVLLQRKTA